MSAMLEVGPSKESIEAAQNAIMTIVNARADQATIREALSAFTRLCRVENVVVSGNVFTNCPTSEEEVEQTELKMKLVHKLKDLDQGETDTVLD